MEPEDAGYAIWDGLLDVSRVVHYYATQERRYERFAFGFRLVLALSGAGVAAPFLTASFIELPDWITPAFGVIITIFVVLDLLRNDAARAAQIKAVIPDLAELESRYRSLWEETRNKSIDDQDALARKRKLMKDLNRIVSNVDIPSSRRIVYRTQKEAFKVEELRYAP